MPAAPFFCAGVAMSMGWKRVFFISILVVIALGTIVTVTMQLLSQWYWSEMGVMGGFCLAIALLMAYLGSVAMEKKRARIIARPAILFSAAMVVELVLCVLTSLIERGIPGRVPWPESSELWGKVLGMTTLYCMICGIGAAMLTPRLPAALRVVQWCTLLTMVTFGILCSVMIGDIAGDSRESVERSIPVLLIVSSAGILVVLFATRLLETKSTAELHDVTRHLYVRCPRCNLGQNMPLRESRCMQCKLLFRLEVEEIRCRTCGYRLQGLENPVCPECGTGFEPAPAAISAA